MADVSIKNKSIAKAALAAFGGKPNVSRYWDENNRSIVDILVCQDRPSKGICSVATIGLSDHPLLTEGEEYRDDEGVLVRVEIVGAYHAAVKEFPNMISTAA